MDQTLLTGVCVCVILNNCTKNIKEKWDHRVYVCSAV